MSNFLVGAVVGFFICVWALDASPVTATVALVDRVRQVQVSFAAEPEPQAEPARVEAEQQAPVSAIP